MSDEVGIYPFAQKDLLIITGKIECTDCILIILLSSLGYDTV